MEQNKGAQRAAWFAGQAVSAATNPKLFIVKVLVTILAVLIGFLFVVGSLFGVIFSQLGFSNSADYTSEMFQIETENLTAAMDTYFSDAGHVASISALLADFDGSRYGTYDTSHMLPSAGTLKSLYDAVDADYNGVYEAHTQVTGEGRKPMVDADGTKVVYEGYTLVSDYDTFWSNGTYQKYFLPLIQNSCTTEDITKMENGDGSVLEADLPVLIESIPWGSWVRGEDLVRDGATA